MNNDNNNNKTAQSTQTYKLYNPKAHAPGVYIPCWLLQVSNSLISHAAKLCYGRLSQWANARGIVYRSSPQLAEEIGTSTRSIERHLKELRDLGLIGTFQPQAGGVNHFEFYDHPWMHEPINDNLSYKDTSPEGSGGTSRQNDREVPSRVADINIRNKINKKTTNKTLVDFEKSPNYKDDFLFMKFYSSYPNKQKPNQAYKTFCKLKPTEELVQQIVNDVFLRTNNNWLNTPKHFIPHPSTYLNAREWEGEIFSNPGQAAKKPVINFDVAMEMFMNKANDDKHKATGGRIYEHNSQSQLLG